MVKSVIQKSGPNKQSVFACFFLMFSYALLLLMITYTANALKNGLVLRGVKGWGNNGLWLALPQLFGLLVGGLALKPIFKRFNIRTIIMGGLTVAGVIIAVFCALDKITDNQQRLALGLYLPLNFLFGLSISFIPPVVSTYLGTNFSGKKATMYVSAVNGLYGLGGGIIPLVAAGPIFKTQNVDDYGKVRYFFYIALAFCLLCVLAGYLLNYRFTEDKKSDLSSRQESTREDRKLLWTLGGLIATCFFFYLIFETGVNYGLSSKYVTNVDFNHSDSQVADKVTLIRGLGLFFCVQGLWRAGSPFLFKKVRYRFFVLFSAVFVAIGYAMLAAKILNHSVNWVYLVAFLLGIGVGNIWPITFSFAQGCLEKKRSTMAIIANMVTFVELPLTATIASFVLNTETNHSVGFTSYAIVCAVLPFLIFGVMTFIIKFLQKRNLTHSDEN